MNFITLGTVDITKQVKDNVNKCLNSGMIGQGSFIEEFEKKTAKVVGTKYAVAVCNGSMADIIALSALKTLYPDKTEVIVPALTFVAQINAVLINGLIPVFVDVGRNYQMDLSQIRITEKTLAVMPVHLLGKVCGIRKQKVPVMEDCCEAFGVKPMEIGTCSFFPSHTITTGEGGMILTDDKKIAKLCKQIRNHGRRSDDILDKFHFDIFGYNGKMSNITAAIGSAIVENTEVVIYRRKENVKKLNEATGQDWYAESPHCYPVMCKDRIARDNKIKELYANGIEARKLFSCLPTQERVYQYMDYEKPGFAIAEDVGERGLYVPCHQNLQDNDIQKICRIIK